MLICKCLSLSDLRLNQAPFGSVLYPHPIEAEGTVNGFGVGERVVPGEPARVELASRKVIAVNGSAVFILLRFSGVALPRPETATRRPWKSAG